jgi:hypothetical protein
MKIFDQFKTKRFGILLIIIGVFIPSILYPFTSITFSASLTKALFATKGVSWDTRIQDLEIVFIKGEWKEKDKDGGGYYEGRLALPYRYTVAFGILLCFFGIGFIAFYKNKGNGD